MEVKVVKFKGSNIDELIEEIVNHINNELSSEEPKNEEVKIDKEAIIYNKAMEKLSKKWNCSPEQCAKFLDKISAASEINALSILLRYIAITLDEQYEDHIKNSPEHYIVSATDGTIKIIDKKQVKSYNTISIFRTLEDARLACRILRPILKSIFKNNGK